MILYKDVIQVYTSLYLVSLMEEYQMNANSDSVIPNCQLEKAYLLWKSTFVILILAWLEQSPLASEEAYWCLLSLAELSMNQQIEVKILCCTKWEGSTFNKNQHANFLITNFWHQMKLSHIFI